VIAVNGDRLVLTGALTMLTVAGLIEEGRRILAGGVSTVDVSGATEVDSAALALLLDWRRSANHALKIVGMPKGMASLATLYDVQDLFA
jgi:phospholipid transport system transporter-binding protein